MTIKSKISFKEYRNLLFGLAYKKPMMKVIVCVGLAMLVWISGYYLHFLPVPKPLIYQYITLILITVVQPAVIYWTIKRNYDSSNHLREQLEIEITQQEIKIQGESFFLEITWEKVFKTDEQKDWFLIYQNTLSAIILPKRDFNSAQLETFKKLLSAAGAMPEK
ncbi:MAG: YcxB family protein [Ferruginibacter sp.]